MQKIENVTRAAAVSHFLLMFGYKLFSLYFPLFLVTRGFSLPQVGYAYLLIYLPIAVFSPIVGFLNHKINPAILTGLGIFGYAFYSLSMIVVREPFVFYLCQIVLGISAALFFVSMRAILIGRPLENFDRSFGWFYSSPFYADALAPAIGAIIIWRFGFIGVFGLSIVFYFFNIVFCFAFLKKSAADLVDDGFSFVQFISNYTKGFKIIREKTVLPFALVSFLNLFVAGFYMAFFVLFLKNIGWSQNQILGFGSLSSAVFLPVSFLLIDKLKNNKTEKNIIKGGLMFGFFTFLFGFFGWFFQIFTLPGEFYIAGIVFFSITTIKTIGGFMVGSARSGLISQKLRAYPEEAGAIDTLFSPLGVAFGSLASGLIIGFLGFSGLFISGGIFVLAAALTALTIHSRKI